MAIATTPTLLSLDRWAKIVGLSPVHFQGADAGHFFPQRSECKDIWYQFAWQTAAELVSREEIAFEIAKAESDLKETLGYSLAPEWEVRESHTWPGASRYPYPNGYYHSGKGFALNYGKLLGPGARNATAIREGAEVVFSDEDADGWEELATVIVTTDVVDRREVKLFFTDHAGDPEWEIRPLRNVVLDAGTATITVDAWLLVAPENWFLYPRDDEGNQAEAIPIATTANYVGEVDVYRIFNDTASPGVNILLADSQRGMWCNYCNLWSGGVCANCGAATQVGTFSLLSGELPFVAPYPASYGDGKWTAEAFATCGRPRIAAFHYYAGAVDKRYESGKTLDPLSDFWADSIAWMAVARLPRGVCGCDNIRERIETMQRDLTRNDQSFGYAHTFKQDLWSSPFGTRAGEVRAWQAVSRIVGDQVVAGSML